MADHEKQSSCKGAIDSSTWATAYRVVRNVSGAAHLLKLSQRCAADSSDRKPLVIVKRESLVKAGARNGHGCLESFCHKLVRSRPTMDSELSKSFGVSGVEEKGVNSRGVRSNLAED